MMPMMKLGCGAELWLCDLRGLFKLEESDNVVVRIGNDRKTILVYCETCCTLCSWGGVECC